MIDRPQKIAPSQNERQNSGSRAGSRLESALRSARPRRAEALLLCPEIGAAMRRRADRVLGAELSRIGLLCRGEYREVLICGSRLWQQGPSEDISAGEWQRRGMM